MKQTERRLIDGFLQSCTIKEVVVWGGGDWKIKMHG